MPLPRRQGMCNAHTSRSVTIGLLLDDGVFRPHPPITGVFEAVVGASDDTGHDVFPWDGSLHAEGIAILDAPYTADSCHDIQTDAGRGGKPLIPAVERLVRRGSANGLHENWNSTARSGHYIRCTSRSGRCCPVRVVVARPTSRLWRPFTHERSSRRL